MSPILQTLAEYGVAVLLIIGGAFLLIGSWGLARLPSLMTRLHGPTKATTLGIGACLVASMIFFPAFTGRGSGHELLIVLFLFVTAPISANMISKAHLHRQARRIDPDAGDHIPDAMPPPPGDQGWATFHGAADPAEKVRDA